MRYVKGMQASSALFGVGSYKFNVRTERVGYSVHAKSDASLTHTHTTCTTRVSLEHTEHMRTGPRCVLHSLDNHERQYGWCQAVAP
jgi:hypothetical protein